MIGNWTISGYYFSTNVAAIGEKEAKGMIGRSVLRIYPHYVADSTDSCSYTMINDEKTNADKYFQQYNVNKSDLKISSEYINVVSFKNVSQDHEQCGALDNEIVVVPDRYLF